MRLRPIWQDRPLRCVSTPWISAKSRSTSRDSRKALPVWSIPFVNAQIPSSKPKESPEPEPTGINYVELLIHKKEE